VAADVYVWRYALLVVHARKEEDIGIGIREPDEGSNAPFIRGPVVVEERMRPGHWLGSVLCFLHCFVTWLGDRKTSGL